MSPQSPPYIDEKEALSWYSRVIEEINEAVRHLWMTGDLSVYERVYREYKYYFPNCLDLIDDHQDYGGICLMSPLFLDFYRKVSSFDRECLEDCGDDE